MMAPTTSFENRLAWFGGLIDGEGCITVNVRKQHVSTLKITPVFSIQMKDGSWLAEAMGILDALNIPYYARKRKNQTEVSVRHWKNILPFLKSIKDYSVVKRPIMERLLCYRPKPLRNRFVSADIRTVKEMAELVDFVRRFNRGKNRPYKWDGNKILEFFEKRK
jgi:hypothetical protein